MVHITIMPCHTWPPKAGQANSNHNNQTNHTYESYVLCGLSDPKDPFYTSESCQEQFKQTSLGD